MERPELTHPAYVTGLGTVIGYGSILTILFFMLFALPYLIFTLL